MAKTILVAGATGYLGGHVVEVAAKAGLRVRALARDESRLAERRASCDEVFVGQATDASTLKGLCDGVDVVFSSLGIRTFGRKPSFWEVDHAANMNVLEQARQAGVEHFIFTSVCNAEKLRSKVGVAEARERVGDALAEGTMRWTVLRPTGFFNDMQDYFAMAKRGSVWLVGDGARTLNPIHGRDLAQEVIQSIEDPSRHGVAVAVGGPDTYSNRGIAELAFEVLGTKPKLRSLPPGLLDSMAWLSSPFNENASSFLRALRAFADMDFIGDPCGTHHLRDFFAELADGG